VVTLLMSSVVTRQADLALSESATRQAANQRIIVEEHDRQMEALQVTTDWLPLTSHLSPLTPHRVLVSLAWAAGRDRRLLRD